MWELNHKQGWVSKNWCFWTAVLEKTLESPLDCKEIKSVSPKGNQSWISIGRMDAEVDAPILFPPDERSRLIRKDPDAGKDWRQEEKGMTEDEMVGWYHQFHGHKFEQALGDGEGQGSLVCAAAAKSLQSCLTLCDPIDGSRLGSPVPGILQARTLEWVAISFSSAWKWKVKMKSLSRVQLFSTPWTAAYQAPPSIGFSRQEYWSGVPLPSPCMRRVRHKWVTEQQEMQYLGHTYIF